LKSRGSKTRLRRKGEGGRRHTMPFSNLWPGR
jgi:hypothetical protein